jgi:hypothetical protein
MAASTFGLCSPIETGPMRLLTTIAVLDGA